MYNFHHAGYVSLVSTTDYHFTAPVRGLYWFTVSIFTGYKAKISITVDGQKMVTAEDTDYWAGDAVSAILMLETGARVSCIKWFSNENLYEEGISHFFNNFAGYLYAEL